MTVRLFDWKWKPGQEPCSCCHDDWEDLVDENDNSFAGSIVIPDCGCGCCHIRVNCDECNGTGIQR